MEKTKRIFYIILGLVIASALAVSLVIAGRIYYDRKIPNFGKTSELYVYPNMTVQDVLDEIRNVAEVRHFPSVARAFRHEGITSADSMRPGHYTINGSNSSIYVARMIHNGWQTPVNLVLSGTMRQQGTIARKISRQMLMDSLEVIDALRDSALLASYGFTTDNVFALFMPDTYQVYWTDSMKSVLDKQKAAYDAFWTDDNKRKAEIQGLSRMEVSVLASIVRGESNYVPEYPQIAGVYLNRLHRGMKLQADPTVAFCYNYTLNRILKIHLKVDSPYNTYLNYGLPPAPINVPGRDAMNAVLNPAGHNDLYFCASPDFNGSHIFASTYAEHLKNARAFQKALNERQKPEVN